MPSYIPGGIKVNYDELIVNHKGSEFSLAEDYIKVFKSASLLKGIAVYTKNTFDYDVSLQAIKDIGFDVLQIGVVTGVNSETKVASKIFTDEFVQNIITLAKNKGFKYIMLKIHTNSRLAVESFESYGAIVNSYAQMCENNGIDSFFVTNEQPQLTNANYELWSNLIASARSSYSGEIGTSLYLKEDETHCFFDLVDIIGWNIYPCMTYKGLDEPTEVCSQAWFDDIQVGKNFIVDMKKLKIATGKKIMITEVGCQPYLGRLAYPGVNNLSTGLSEETQKKFYDATLPLVGNLDFLDGVFLWEGIESYTPIGRLAETAVINWLGGV